MSTVALRLSGVASGFGSALRGLARRGRFSPRTSRRPKTPAQAGFQAVEVRRGLECCQAAAAIEGKRFLASQAPALPLAGCDADQCQCRYMKFADRRRPGDRRFGSGYFGDNRFGAGGERRQRRDRRSF